MALKELPKDKSIGVFEQWFNNIELQPQTEDIVKTLNDLTQIWHEIPHKTEAQLELGKFLIMHQYIFNGSYNDALNPYQMIGEDGKTPKTKGAPSKYQHIKDIKEHVDLNAAYKDSKNDLYLELIIKIGGVGLKLDKEKPPIKELSPSKIVGIARLLTAKRLKVSEIIAIANQAASIMEEEFAAQVSDKLNEKRPRKPKFAAAKAPTINIAELDKLIKKTDDVKTQLNKADRDLRQITNNLYQTMVAFKALAEGTVEIK